MHHRPTLLQAVVHVATVLTLPASLFVSSAYLWPYDSIALFALNGLVIVCLIQLSTSEPAMEELVDKRRFANFRPAPYLARPNTHVIENERCKVCLIHAPKGTKHCRKCNACIAGFDHHCTWLNMCIGSKNYKLFIVFLCLVVIVTGVHSAVFSLILVLAILKKDCIQLYKSFVRLPFMDCNVVIWAALAVILLLLSFVLCLSTCNLLIFHLRLWRSGQSTYYYITQQRRMQRRLHPDSSTESRGTTASRIEHHPNRRSVADETTASPIVMETDRNKDAGNIHTVVPSINPSSVQFYHETV